MQTKLKQSKPKTNQIKKQPKPNTQQKCETTSGNNSKRLGNDSRDLPD